MALIKSILFIYTVYVIQCTHCCWEAEDNIVYCNTFLEVSMEGKPEWRNVSIENFGLKPLHTLQANNFEKIPNIVNLTIYNTINVIESDAFNPLKKLVNLQLIHNKITDLPANIFNVKSLKQVLLFGNKITAIPPDSFKKIDSVSLNNRIRVIKANMFSNSAIQDLYLIGCDIEVIEDGSFMRMNSLHILALTKNLITSFNVKRLIGNSLSLRGLYVDFNRLTSVPRDMFDGAEWLILISLKGNHIESVEDGAFSRLEYLSLLDLSDNRLVQVQPQIFRAPRQPNLTVLGLHDNRLTFINLAMLARAYKLEYFSYAGNPIQCPCIDGIKDYLRKQNIQQTCFDKLYLSGDLPSCIVPLEYADVCLDDVGLRSDLYELYKDARVQHKIFEKVCNVSDVLNKPIFGKFTEFYQYLNSK